MLTPTILKSGRGPRLIILKTRANVALCYIRWIIFGWLAVWVPRPDWLCRIMQKCDVWWALRWSRNARGRRVRAVPRLWIYTLSFTIELRKITENRSQDSRKALSWSALDANRLVDLVVADDYLEWPPHLRRPWLSRQATGSTLVQRTYLPSYCTRGFPHQLTLSQSSQSVNSCIRF
jgi:hypothetical protein